MILVKESLILLIIKNAMENRQALKLIEKIQKEILFEKFTVDQAIEDLKKIREITMEMNNPVVTKALRLAYQHLEANNGFMIGIPDDEPLDSKDVKENTASKTTHDIESLNYFLTLFTDLDKKNNVLDLKEYNKAFLAF